jgi:hypothetical protein
MSEKQERAVWGVQAISERIERAAGIASDVRCTRDSVIDDEINGSFRVVAGRSGFGRGRVIHITDPVARESIAATIRAERVAHDAKVTELEQLFAELEPIVTRIEAVLGIVDVTSNAG